MMNAEWRGLKENDLGFSFRIYHSAFRIPLKPFLRLARTHTAVKINN